MLRRPPTSINLTAVDIASYDYRRSLSHSQARPTSSASSTFQHQEGIEKKGGGTGIDPNDELKPLPQVERRREERDRERIMGR